ncbi:hypothetical protein N7495_000700 [Penicillium taxi]|uniref:uncharacterized protein n=1 Tax=Penicillium taxi TaxID=168475 RepID=UPI002545AF85|nr:uncharacterized protein N7495_000700 [Penicillium taxi]KAJ5908018.1 hypothetical protein N7495_000700 [Penicillium taxi]
MTIPWIWPVRAAQVLFSLIVIGLTAYVVDVSAWWSYTSIVNFLLFVGCWSAFLAIPYLVALVYYPNLSNRYLVPAMEIVTTIFWFAGFVALGATLPPAAVCYGNVCRSLQAATVFSAFEWVVFVHRALFMVTTYFAIMDFTHNRHCGETANKSQGHTNISV